MPWVRWNFPPATAMIPELITELQDMKVHNIAGAEIGQSGIPTNDQLVAIYNRANALGVKISLKVARRCRTRLTRTLIRMRVERSQSRRRL